MYTAGKASAPRQAPDALQDITQLQQVPANSSYTRDAGFLHSNDPTWDRKANVCPYTLLHFAGGFPSVAGRRFSKCCGLCW